MKKAVTFGEIMLRLSPEGRKRFVQADRFDAVYGGSEANVAIALGNMGIKADFLTVLPDSPLGDAAENFVRSFGVNTKGTVRKDGRLGIYFLEKGASQRPSKVVYDREDSVFSRLKEGEIDFKKAFERADWFHFSGITPALSRQVALITKEAVCTAKEMGLTVSCDLNYRAALWSTEQAAEVLRPLISMTDVLIANENPS